MSSQSEKGISKMAAMESDDATATFKGDDEKKTSGKKQIKKKLRLKVTMLKPLERPQVKLQKMQRRTKEKMPMVKLKTTMMQ